MAHKSRGGCARLGSPFLRDGFETPEDRHEGIAEEVQWYLQNRLGMDLPPDAVVPEQPPAALYWLLQKEEHGLPFSGGFLEQPWHFMQDLEAAMLGRSRVREIQAANARMRQQQREKQSEQQYGQDPNWANRLLRLTR